MGPVSHVKSPAVDVNINRKPFAVSLSMNHAGTQT